MAENALEMIIPRTNENIQTAQQFQYNQDQINTIRETVAKGATDTELKMFLHLCQKYNLDPFLKEIWFVKRAKKTKDKNGNWDYRRLPDGNIDYTGAETMIMTSRDGYLRVAQDDINFNGIKSFTVKEGDVFEVDAQTDQIVHKFGLKRGRILGAWSAVYHKQRRPVICFAEFSEYNDDKSTTWKKYPSAMIMKVAEVFALKRQFGISGLTTQEELTAIAEHENIIEIPHEKTIEITGTTEIPQPVNWPAFWAGVKSKLGYSEGDVHGIASAMRKTQITSLSDWSREEVAELMEKLKQVYAEDQAKLKEMERQALSGE